MRGMVECSMGLSKIRRYRSAQHDVPLVRYGSNGNYFHTRDLLAAFWSQGDAITCQNPGVGCPGISERFG
jgi:hypothetical protein